MSSEARPFRVIVVGAGVAGLAAAHAFQKAGIEHVVLERRSTVAPAEGASIAMYPHGARILHQLGCLTEVQKHSTTPGRWRARLPSGKSIANNGVFRVLEANHGSGLLLIERRQFLQDLYDTLPEKTRIKTSCTVLDIKQDETGVEVILANGEVERGDLVLGCDGVYSFVRRILWEHANRTSPGLITVDEKRAIRADWKCLVVTTGPIPELGDRDLTVVHNKNYSHMFTMTPTHGFFFVFFHLDEPRTYPQRLRYTAQDADIPAEQIANHPMSETLVFGEVWKQRIRAAVVNLEEGVLDHWYHGRIVLAGDSVHKVTPNMAFGGNSGLESVVVLTNRLRRMLVENNWARPSGRELEKLLSAYQTERLARMKYVMQFSGDVTKVQAWHRPLDKFLATWLVPMLPDRTFGDQLGKIISGAPKLDFIDASDFPSGRMPWQDEANKGVKREGRVEAAASAVSSLLRRTGFSWLSAAAAFLMVLYAASFYPVAAQASAGSRVEVV